MSFKDSLIKFFGGVTQGDLREALMSFPGLAGIDPDEAAWRKLSGDVSRELNPLAQDRMIEIAHYLYEINPVAGRLAEIPRDFICGEGVKVSGTHPDVDAVIEKFWHDPVNQWDLKLPKKVLELGLYGEQCWPVFVSVNAGRVRLGYIDPGMIADVIADPENIEMLIGVVTKDTSNRPGKKYRIVLDADEAEILSPAARALRNRFADGQVFYFSINAMSNSRRGRSDLLSLIDWLDGYEDMLYGQMERAQDLQAFIWDVKLTGMTPEQVQDYANRQSPPKPGSVRFHNDAVEWKAESPDLKSADVAQHARTFLAHIAARKGYPIHWLTSADDVNVATAKEMAIPTLKAMSMRQLQIKAIIEKVVRFALRQAVAAAVLPAEIELLDKEGEGTGKLRPAVECFRVEMPELSVKDMGALATAFSQISSSLALSVNAHLLTRETATRAIANIAGMMGLDIDAEEEIEKALAAAKEQPDYNTAGMGALRQEFNRAANDE